MGLKSFFTRKKNNADSVFEVIELLQTLNNRKLKHLSGCVDGFCKQAKIPYVPPKSFLTDYELKILDRMKGEKAEQLKNLVLKSFDEHEIEK